MAMNVMVEAKLNHVVEVFSALVLVDIAAPDVSFPGKEYLAVDGCFLAVLILFAMDYTVKAMSPSLLALLCHEELGDFNVEWLLFPLARRIWSLFAHMIVFICFLFSTGNIIPALRNVYAE